MICVLKVVGFASRMEVFSTADFVVPADYTHTKPSALEKTGKVSCVLRDAFQITQLYRHSFLGPSFRLFCLLLINSIGKRREDSEKREKAEMINGSKEKKEKESNEPNREKKQGEIGVYVSHVWLIHAEEL